MSPKFDRRLVVAIFLLLALMLPTTVLAQKAKSTVNKVPTPFGPFPSELIYGVTTSNLLISFNSGAPGTILSSVAITGLQAGETILGIDFRPANKQLYGLGSTSRLYSINLSTGAATAVGSQFTPALSGTAFGFDFNPVVDRIRVTSSSGQNLRLNPNDATAIIDINLSYAAGDVNAGATPRVVGSAYTVWSWTWQ